MYAIINRGNGRYYTSAVYGIYNNTISYYNNYKQFFIVLDEEKKRLIRCKEYNPKKRPYLYKQILITDGDMSDWIMDENGYGSMDFLPKEIALEYSQKKTPAEILEKCLEYDSRNTYTEVRSVKTEKDIDDLMWASGYFHDAYIAELSPQEDGIRILFDGVWGCKIEVFFTGDVSYDVHARDPEDDYSYWSGSTVTIHDGYIYLIDEDKVKVDEIDEGYCWFRGRDMSYHIIPD